MTYKRIGLIGTGFTARGLALAIERQQGMKLSRVLTRRNPSLMTDFRHAAMLTNSTQELIEHSDVVVDCSGDVLYVTEVIVQVMEAGLPVITLNAELQVTTGSYLAGKGMITEAEGDQPGSLAALHENVVQMGFKPLVYGSVQGAVDHKPSQEAMVERARRLGLSVEMMTSISDGTKVQFAQALVANGIGCGIALDGLFGLPAESVEDVADRMALTAKKLGYPISDYMVSNKSAPGVFIVAEHDLKQEKYLRYLHMGDGPFYTVVTPYRLAHLEAIKTIRRVLNGGGSLLNNGLKPRVSVAAVAKRELLAGERIGKGSGSFECRGIAIRLGEYPDHVPMGLLSNAVVSRPVEEGAILRFHDVELPDSMALKAWNETAGMKHAAISG